VLQMSEGSSLSEQSTEFEIEAGLYSKLIKKYERLNRLILNEGLKDVHSMAPILNGYEICGLYEIKQGKALKFYLEEEIKFQITHPGVSREDVLVYMKHMKSEFTEKYAA